jgi:hypothetical protein
MAHLADPVVDDRSEQAMAESRLTGTEMALGSGEASGTRAEPRGKICLRGGVNPR